ncbi:MAG: hypothetical protein V6Z86_04910 [Hyphomicrobiales bacterium]
MIGGFQLGEDCRVKPFFTIKEAAGSDASQGKWNRDDYEKHDERNAEPPGSYASFSPLCVVQYCRALEGYLSMLM